MEEKMFGKKIRVNDYKFTYGSDIVYINVYAVFRVKKSNEKFIIYSYDDKKLFYGSLYINGNMGTVMASDKDNTMIVDTILLNIFDNKSDDKYEILDISKIDSIQIIEEKVYEKNIDINRLYDITMPKEKIEEENISSKKNNNYWVFIILIILIIGVIIFISISKFISLKKEIYVCEKKYEHNSLPADVIDKIDITFDYKNKLIDIDNSTSYVFTDTNYYYEFKDNSYFYKYIDNADTYKFDDSNYTYRVFKNIDVNDDKFLSRDKDSLVSYYENKGYTCNLKEE